MDRPQRATFVDCSDMCGVHSDYSPLADFLADERTPHKGHPMLLEVNSYLAFLEPYRGMLSRALGPYLLSG